MSQWRRVRPPQATVEAFPNVRCWQKDLDDGHLSVLRTIEQLEDGGPWIMHISISHRNNDLTPGRYPTWDEQKEAVWKFAPGKAMISWLLPEGDFGYINIHPTTFHWWEAEQ